MEEGEHKLCLVEPTLELAEEMVLQVQMQLLELVEDREALVAAEEAAEEAVAEAVAEAVGGLPLLLVQEQMEVVVELVELEAMEAAVAAAVVAVAAIFIRPV